MLEQSISKTTTEELLQSAREYGRSENWPPSISDFLASLSTGLRCTLDIILSEFDYKKNPKSNMAVAARSLAATIDVLEQFGLTGDVGLLVIPYKKKDPSEIAERRASIIEQYMKAKGQHPNAIVFIRVGDFFETYAEDATTASKVLGAPLSLINNKDNPEKVPMCGAPWYSRSAWSAEFIKAGHEIILRDKNGT